MELLIVTNIPAFFDSGFPELKYVESPNCARENVNLILPPKSGIPTIGSKTL